MIRIVTGFTAEQKYSIPDEEAHKAYYLFLNPNERGIFSNGLGLTGKQIQAVEADYQGTMGWNPSHKLDDDDWNQIRAEGVDRKLREVLQKAREVVSLIAENPKLLNEKLSEIEVKYLK